MTPDDPVSVLRRVVELCTCYGEPVDRIDSDDPRLVEYLRVHQGDGETIVSS